MITVFWSKHEHPAWKGLPAITSWSAYMRMLDGDCHLLFTIYDEQKFFDKYNSITFLKVNNETKV